MPPTCHWLRHCTNDAFAKAFEKPHRPIILCPLHRLSYDAGQAAYHTSHQPLQTKKIRV